MGHDAHVSHILKSVSHSKASMPTLPICIENYNYTFSTEIRNKYFML